MVGGQTASSRAKTGGCQIKIRADALGHSMAATSKTGAWRHANGAGTHGGKLAVPASSSTAALAVQHAGRHHGAQAGLIGGQAACPAGACCRDQPGSGRPQAGPGARAAGRRRHREGGEPEASEAPPKYQLPATWLSSASCLCKICGAGCIPTKRNLAARPVAQGRAAGRQPAQRRQAFLLWSDFATGSGATSCSPLP